MGGLHGRYAEVHGRIVGRDMLYGLIVNGFLLLLVRLVGGCRGHHAWLEIVSIMVVVVVKICS